MTPARTLFAAVSVFIFAFCAAGHAAASAQDAPSQQAAGGSVSGMVTTSSGQPAGNAKITIKNLSTGETTGVQADSTGRYETSRLAPGEYEITAAGDGSGTATKRVSVAAGGALKLDLALGVAQQNLPNAPSANQTQPSLSDLGFSPAETQADAKRQALLDKRTHMLKIHQRMGLITTIPMVASVVTSLGAGGKSEGTASRDLHVALGALTGDLYGITAYYAIRAPRIPGTETRGPIKVHKALAWVHGTGMVLTPILGAMAFNQKNNGERVHGLASAHGPVAIITAGAFGAALISVSAKF
ncbi:MAG TPA: carboxypeptidase-like regulatory domain-containing protein [Candidatus Sulfotelmatobacter sp.]|nr:carboxypeptidase-like regulatory domain-containing protein [Candidatus Sulfotelmatobacter sp.]